MPLPTEEEFLLVNKNQDDTIADLVDAVMQHPPDADGRYSQPVYEATWKLVRSGTVLLGVIENGELPAIHALMSRYWDRPMDFADATLVHLATRESISTIFTIDQDDFATYRIEGKRQFNILPLERPR